jgi:hypothetical protein
MAEPAAQPFQQPKREYQPLKPEDLSNFVADPEALKLPAGYHWYETMIVLRASINDQDRCVQLQGESCKQQGQQMLAAAGCSSCHDDSSSWHSSSCGSSSVSLAAVALHWLVDMVAASYASTVVRWKVSSHAGSSSTAVPLAWPRVKCTRD